MKLYRSVLALLFLLGLAACGESPYTNIGNEELQTLLAQGVPMYDIRLPEKWRETGVIEGSRRMTLLDPRKQPGGSKLSVTRRRARFRDAQQQPLARWPERRCDCVAAAHAFNR